MPLRKRPQGKALLRHRARPSEEGLARAFLSHAARDAAAELTRVPDAEFEGMLLDLVDLPSLDLSLQAELPQLCSPKLDRLCDAVAEDDAELAEDLLDEVMGVIDTPSERARLARAVIALRDAGRLDGRLAASALIDLASGARLLTRASLLEAVALRAGIAQTPAGILLAA